MEKRIVLRSAQKEKEKYYNCGVKKYLIKNYYKLKTGLGPQKR